MQDKEFDTLFRSKLENFEAAPTSQVWDGVVEGLDGKRRYAVLLPWLSIAASVLVLVAAGILFIPHKAAVKPSVNNGIAKAPVAPQVVKPAPATPQPQNILQKPTQAAVNNMARIKPLKSTTETVVKNTPTETVAANTAQPQEEQVIAAVRPNEVISPEAPDRQTQLTAPQTIDVTAAVTTKPTIAALTLPVIDKQNATPVRPRHKARGFGGLLNTMIAAVDKRKDKIIEFTESDDDDASNITAVNLGILKFKKDKPEVSRLTK